MRNLILVTLLFIVGSCQVEKMTWKTDCSNCPKEQTKNLAVMIEPRNSEPVVEIVHNFIDYLKPEDEWAIQLFHSSLNEKKIKDDKKIADVIKQGKIILSKLNADNLTVSLYDSIIYNIDFWQDLRANEKILIFQSDTGLCPHPNDSLSHYLKYDFVGAPWGNLGPLCALYDVGDKIYVDFIEFG